MIEYLLPEEDLEDLNIIKSKYEFIEKYDFKEIINKYNLNDSIIALMFKNGNEMRILTRISVNDDTVLKNLSFSKIDINNTQDIENIINNLKIIYEDHWKGINQINTSIKLDLTISVDNSNIIKIDQFEKTLSSIELVNNFNIFKFDNKKNIYKVIFNGTRDQFLNVMKDYDYFFEIKNKIWLLK